MRVPTRSAGTRSGVNWIRLKSPVIACATVFTLSVFASPGTPSTSRCPRAKSATRMRSSKWSCPTMTFLISKRSRAMSPGSVSVSFILPTLPLIHRDAERAARGIDRDREAEAAEDREPGRVRDRGDDTDDVAVAVEERPARVPGVRGRIELDETGQRLRVAGHLERPVQSADDARRERASHAEGAAHDERVVADPDLRTVPEHGRDDGLRRLERAQDGDVVVREHRDDADRPHRRVWCGLRLVGTGPEERAVRPIRSAGHDLFGV